jgi:hypothetical protein
VTSSSIKLNLMCVLLAVSSGLTSEREDRADIERVVRILDDGLTTAAQKRALFTTDAQNQFDRLAEFDHRMIGEPHARWSETTPGIAIQSIRFITPDVALVDATNTRYGSVIFVRRVPVLIVIKKEKQDWRIAALRVLSDLSSLP